MNKRGYQKQVWKGQWAAEDNSGHDPKNRIDVCTPCGNDSFVTELVGPDHTHRWPLPVLARSQMLKKQATLPLAGQDSWFWGGIYWTGIYNLPLQRDCSCTTQSRWSQSLNIENSSHVQGEPTVTPACPWPPPRERLLLSHFQSSSLNHMELWVRHGKLLGNFCHF